MKLGITHAQHLSQESRAAYRLGLLDGWAGLHPVPRATRCAAWYVAGHKVGQVIHEEGLPILPVIIDLEDGAGWLVSGQD